MDAAKLAALEDEAIAVVKRFYYIPEHVRNFMRRLASALGWEKLLAELK